MLRFDVRNGVRFVVVLAALAVGTFVPVLAQASVITVGTQVFSDDFTGSTLDTTKWAQFTQGTGTVAMDGVSSVVLTSVGTSSDRRSSSADIEAKSALNFSSSPNDWGVEIKLQMRSGEAWQSYNNPADLPGAKQFSILSGTSAVLGFTMQGFDLRAVRYNASNWCLGWYGFDETGTRVCDELTAGIPLSSSVTHTVSLHRKTDGNVDIYVDDGLVATKALIGGSNPVGLMLGDFTSTAIAGVMALDSVKIGIVPEPSALALLSTSLIGLLAYAWRKRK